MQSQEYGDSREAILFEGRPSQVVNYNYFTVCAMVFAFTMILPGLYTTFFAHYIPKYHDLYMLCAKAAFFLPIFMAGKAWLQIHNHHYIITTERLKEREGILSRKTEELQLYRVKDVTLVQPFSLRVFGCGNVVLDTSDKTTPIVVLRAIKDPQKIVDLISKYVELSRIKKGVREIDG